MGRIQQFFAVCQNLADTKHLLAIQQERNAALAILDASDDELATTLHFDTTSRKRIKGEWPSIIIRMNGGKKLTMRPLNMAVKTRGNITSLLVNTLKQRSIASATNSKELWETSALMTDSVAKNLQIEEQNANTLMPNHIQFHLLCVSHTFEVFDKFLLCEIERKIGLKELLISHIPMLRSFLFNGRGVTLAALTSFTKLAINDGHKSLLYEQFDQELQVAAKSRKFSEFKERRFGLLGYTAAAILYHMDEFKNVLQNPRSNNLLVQACNLYINRLHHCAIAVFSLVHSQSYNAIP